MQHLTDPTNPRLSPSPRLENLIDVLPTVLMRHLQVMELLVQIRDVRLELRRLGREPLLHIRRRAEHKPITMQINSPRLRKTDWVHNNQAE